MKVNVMVGTAATIFAASLGLSVLSAEQNGAGDDLSGNGQRIQAGFAIAQAQQIPST